MASTITVRPARAADMDAVGRLGALLVAEHHDFDPQRFLTATGETPRLYARFLGSQLARADVFVLVAERGSDILGYAYAGVEGNDYMALRGPAGAIYDLVVDPDHRRQGAGTALLEAVLSLLAGRGEPRVVLSTAERNQVAQRMFERAGFRRTMIELTRELGTD